MLWCPKCKTEYNDGCKTCSDCNSELVDKPEDQEKTDEPQFDKEAFLASVGDSIEADMIEGLLNAYNIPVLKKYRESGGYLKIYMGGTNFGVDLYVPSQLLSKAQEIVANNQETSVDEELQASDAELQLEEPMTVDEEHQDEELQGTEDDGATKAEEGTTGEEDAFDRNRRIRTWIIILFFIPGLIWIIFALVSSLYHWLAK